MASKPVRRPEVREVVYDEGRWRLLRELRARAMEIMEALAARGIYSVVHGSIARASIISIALALSSLRRRQRHSS